MGPKLRKKFAQSLMKYKKVDCPSLVLNNMSPFDGKGHPHPKNHLEFMSDYKFSIAFENYPTPCYITEKIVESFLAGSIPIYWGAIDIEKYFNPAAFIHCRNYPSFQAVIQKIIEIDNDPQLYWEYRRQPLILPDSKLFDLTEEKEKKKMVEVIEKLTDSTYVPVCHSGKISKFFLFKKRINKIRKRLIKELLFVLKPKRFDISFRF